jgi:hypothetical protein
MEERGRVRGNKDTPFSIKKEGNIEGFRMYKDRDKQNKVIDNKAIKYYNLIK